MKFENNTPKGVHDIYTFRGHIKSSVKDRQTECGREYNRTQYAPDLWMSRHKLLKDMHNN